MERLREFAVAHLQLRLQGLLCPLTAAVRTQAEFGARLAEQDIRTFCITEHEALHLLGHANRFAKGSGEEAPSTDTATDTVAEARLRDAARDEGIVLPFDALAAYLELTPFEEFAITACAAPEADRSYERIYAFVLDDLSRRAPCLELLMTLAASSLADRVACRHALSRFGKLRRSKLLVARGDAISELRQELRLGEGLFDYLTGNGSDLATLVRDTIVTAPSVSNQGDDARVARLADSMSSRALRVVGIWGSRQSRKDELAHVLAARTGAAIRRWRVPASDALQSLREALQEASVAGALLWIDADNFSDPLQRDTSAAVADELALSSVPVLLTAPQPWRPPALLATVDYAELELEAPDFAARRELWLEEMPELPAAAAGELARRLRLSRLDIRASIRLARGHAQEAGEKGNPIPLSQLQRATTALAESRCRQFASIIRPKRGPDDLILPPVLHNQVLEIAQFFRAWPTVESWGFARLATGEGSIKALFTGESGTGKTLAAEVIAGELQMPLLRVELSRVVSKWVGETEKNLDATFAEADDSQAVLLFDEADALFGKRGNVESGIDRYANLEVSYLLQRLDDYGGLVILASNLKDNIDAAFTRRFQTVLHFPRPERAERLRIWRMAFPRDAPLDPSIDFDALANLDLTGAGIVSAARTAALFAAQEAACAIGKTHIVRAIARQFRREARLLTPIELGPYASLLQEVR